MSIFLVIVFLFIVKTITKPYLKSPPKKFGLSEKYPVKYPKGPMSDDYSDILAEIENCTDLKSMNTVYIRILIFQGCYPGSASLLSELMESYHKKEMMINS